MYKENKIAIVVPSYNEETQIEQVIKTMPSFVDHIVIVDDCSPDRTSEVVESLMEEYPQVLLLKHEVNQGVGGAIATGYKWARDNDIDAAVVMAGDGQMHPKDLPAILDPVVEGEVDYSKGNRLFTGEAYQKIPKVRYFGNSILSLLTKIASGYWHVADSQTGYTAINKKALHTIKWDKMYKRYGQPNDLLTRLNLYNFRVRDVPIEPVYNVGEKSGIKVRKVLFSISWLVLKLFFWRLKEKYIIRDFHPLVLFYLTGILLVMAGACFGGYVIWYRLFIGSVLDNTPLFTIFLTIFGWQFILFAMWFDMEYNKDLK
jgi:glycosyltransferase involved in cell wall biosynthesis